MHDLALVMLISVSVSFHIFKNTGGNILFVAHKGSIDTFTNKLCCKPPRDPAIFRKLVHRVPYCALGVIEEEKRLPGKWKMVKPPVPCFSQKGDPKYDWTMWL